MNHPTLRLLVLCLLPVALSLGSTYPGSARQDEALPGAEEPAIRVQFLEIVTPEVEATCDLLEKTHGVEFGEPEAALGGARVAALHGGGLLSVRAPLREDEAPVVRPYLLVEDIEAAVQDATAAGGEVAIPPMEIPGRGRFAIYLLGGIDHGLWEI